MNPTRCALLFRAGVAIAGFGLCNFEPLREPDLAAWRQQGECMRNLGAIAWPVFAQRSRR